MKLGISLLLCTSAALQFVWEGQHASAKETTETPVQHEDGVPSMILPFEVAPLEDSVLGNIHDSSQNDTSTEPQEKNGVPVAITTVRCQDAFAYHNEGQSTTFADMTFDDNGDADLSWGWSNGPFVPSEDSWETLELLSEDGVQLGSAIWEYDGRDAVVTYDTHGELWIEQAHTYVGISPAQSGEASKYPNIHDFNKVSGVVSDTFMVSGFHGDQLHLAAHARICGYFQTKKPISEFASDPSEGKQSGFLINWSTNASDTKYLSSKTVVQ